MSVEFDQTIGLAGAIRVPSSLRDGFSPGTQVRVRLMVREESTALAAKGVTEEEIDTISRLQMEPREQVVKCLLSEGSLRRRAHRQKAVPSRGRR